MIWWQVENSLFTDFDMHFVMHPNRLHYFDPNQKHELTMVQTVKDMLEGYSNIQIQKAKEAHEFQVKVSHSST